MSKLYDISKSELVDYVDQLTKYMDRTKDYHKWFKQNAKLYHIINKVESVKVQKRNRTKIKRCFDNCGIFVGSTKCYIARSNT